MKSSDEDYQKIEIYQQQTRETISFKKDIFIMKKRVFKTIKGLLKKRINGIKQYK